MRVERGVVDPERGEAAKRPNATIVELRSNSTNERRRSLRESDPIALRSGRSEGPKDPSVSSRGERSEPRSEITRTSLAKRGESRRPCRRHARRVHQTKARSERRRRESEAVSRAWPSRYNDLTARDLWERAATSRQRARSASGEGGEEQSTDKPSRRRSGASHGFAERRNLGSSLPPT